jgi:8-oxo-dGTP diphosphatase
MSLRLARKDGEESSTGVILAAGGLVWRETWYGRQVAVIHRPKYDDWCLPKGKVTLGERPEQAALREVKEEIGCEATLGSFAGTTQYYANSVPKLVLFWNMTASGASNFTPTEEVDRVIWLTPARALKRLDHSEEKTLLSSAHLSSRTQANSSAPRRFRWVDLRGRTKRYARLTGSVAAYRMDLQKRVCNAAADERSEDWCWVDAAVKSIEGAEAALERRRIDEGWKLLRAAQRLELLSATNGELDSRATTIRHEADKLNSWRKKAVYELLGPPEHPKPFLPKDRVYEATLLRDEHYDNQAYRDRFLRTHQIHLWVALVLILFLSASWKGLLATYGLFDAKAFSPPYDPFEWRMYLPVALFGLFGSTISAMLKFPDSSRSPELTASLSLTLLRLFMGAASAIVIYVFVTSILAETMFSGLRTIAASTIFAISIVAGFTERLVVRAMNAVSEQKS